MWGKKDFNEAIIIMSKKVKQKAHVKIIKGNTLTMSEQIGNFAKGTNKNRSYPKQPSGSSGAEKFLTEIRSIR